MKLLILRGGSPRRRSDTANPASPSTAPARGVMALGNGSGHWVLVNLAPAAAHQLDSDAGLDQHAGLGDARTRTVVLTDAHIDHVGGLLSLHGGAPIALYATPAVFEQLTTALPVLPVLQHYCSVHWHVIPVAGDRQVASFRVPGLPGLEFTAVASAGLPLPHLAQGEAPRVGDSIALAVRDLATGQRLFCAPGLARIGATELAWMQGADCLLLDALPGEGSASDAPSPPWQALLRELPARHKLLFSDAAGEASRAAWADAGVALACDGMEFEV